MGCQVLCCAFVVGGSVGVMNDIELRTKWSVNAPAVASLTALSPPDFLTVEEAAQVVRIGRTKAYDLARLFLVTNGVDGLPVIRFGKQLRVPRCRLEALLGGPITWPPAIETVTAEPAPVVADRVVQPMRNTRTRRRADDQVPRLFID